MSPLSPIRRVVVAALAVTLGSTVMSGSADAISRYTSTSMSCATIKATLRNEGAAILRWKSSRTGNLLYGRYVSSRANCSVNEVTEVDYIPASNTKSCAVRKCVNRSKLIDDDDDWLLFGR